SVDEALRIVAEQPLMAGRPLVAEVSTPEPYVFADRGRARIAVVDYGCKRSILNRLAAAGAAVTVFPHSAQVRDLHAFDGILLSNGPGDPAQLTDVDETVVVRLSRMSMLGCCIRDI